MKIGEYLETLSVEAYDEIVERLVEAVSEAISDSEPSDEPSDEELDRIALELEARSSSSRDMGIGSVSKVLAVLRRQDPYVRPTPQEQGKCYVYRRRATGGKTCVEVVLRIPPRGDEENGSWEERPVTLVFREDGRWRCCCHDFVRGGSCRHVTALAPTPRGAPLPDEQAHSDLCACGGPAWVADLCRVCHLLSEERWLSDWERSFRARGKGIR